MTPKTKNGQSLLNERLSISTVLVNAVQNILKSRMLSGRGLGVSPNTKFPHDWGIKGVD
jgi:hypothetical protein